MTAIADPEKLRCPLERVTVYWCDSAMGIHYDSSQGEWNGNRKRPEAYIRADLHDACLASQAAEIAELRERLDTEIRVSMSQKEALRSQLAAAEAVLQTYADERAPVSTVTRGGEFYEARAGKLARSYFDKLKDPTP